MLSRIIPLMVGFLLSYSSALANDERLSIGITNPNIWQETLVAYALISATIPVLKGFVGSFDTSALVHIDQSNSGIRSHHHQSTAQRTPIIGTTASSVGRGDGSGIQPSDRTRLRPVGPAMLASAWHEDHRDDLSETEGSQDNIIRFTVEYEVIR